MGCVVVRRDGNTLFDVLISEEVAGVGVDEHTVWNTQYVQKRQTAEQDYASKNKTNSAVIAPQNAHQGKGRASIARTSY